SYCTTTVYGFQKKLVTTFDVFEQVLVIALPHQPAAVVMYFWSRDATRRGMRTWHITVPAVVGAVSIPLALYAGSPALTVAIIAVTAMSIFAALLNFWTLPPRFLSGPAAAAGVALINTIGNLGGFSAPYLTGAVRDWTGDYHLPMVIVGLFMLASAVLMQLLSQHERRQDQLATPKVEEGAQP